jgi:mRNA interferase MazF
MRPGQIWMVDLGDPLGHESGFVRPAVVIGNPRMTGHVNFVCPLTTTRRTYPWRIEIAPTSLNGLSQTSYIQCEHLRSISGKRAVDQLGVVDLFTLRRLDATLRLLLTSAA